MRTLAIVMLVLVVLVGAFIGYCYYGAQMQVNAAVATMTPAVEVMGTYDEVVSQLKNGTFYGTMFHETEMLMAESFEFLTLTVRMTNSGFLPMEWIRIEVVPDAADILQLAPDRAPTLPTNSRLDFSTTVLTRTGADTTRNIVVTYYVLGREMKATYQM